MEFNAPIPVIPPKVLLVGPCFSGGGAEGRFTNIAKNLFSGNIDVAVLATKDTTTYSFTGEVINMDWTGRLSYPKLVWQLVRRIRQKKYDVLMSFGFFPIVISIVALLFIGGDTKIVINEITRPKKAGQSGRNKVYNILRQVLYGRSTMITANSIDGLKETCELAGVPVKNAIRVVNAIDINLLNMKAMEKSGVPIPKGKYIVCIARLEFMKRIDTVIDAFASLAGQISCQLVVIGDGKARSTLESHVARICLGDMVVFTGKLDNPFPLLVRSSAFVLASEYEGFSNSVLEAMFCDIPVITSFCSSDAREMCAGGAALGFEVGDYKHLAKHITSVVTNDVLNHELVQHARHYRAPHALENAIPFYEKLIGMVLK